MSHDTPNLPARPVIPDEGERTVSLREFEQRLFSNAQQINDRIRAERELVEERSKALEKALELNASEIARRLNELNGAHERAVDMWNRSLERSVFDTTLAEWTRWRDSVNNHVVTVAQISTRLSQVETALRAAETQLVTVAAIPATKVALADRIKRVEEQLIGMANFGPDIGSLQSQLKKLEDAFQQMQGGIAIIRFMGMAGVIGLIVTFLRMLKVVP